MKKQQNKIKFYATMSDVSCLRASLYGNDSKMKTKWFLKCLFSGKRGWGKNNQRFQFLKQQKQQEKI